MATIFNSNRNLIHSSFNDVSSTTKPPGPSLRRRLHSAVPILRSDPYNELTPFIQHLWTTRPDVCRTVFVDLFPRGKDGRGATKGEEDDFISHFFDEDTIIEQGARFLKQVLYSIAMYNHTRVVEAAGNWKKIHPELFADAGIVDQMVKATTTRVFFDEDDVRTHHHDEALLFRTMQYIQDELLSTRPAIVAKQTLESPAEASGTVAPRERPVFKPVTYDSVTQTARKVSDKISPTTTPQPSYPSKNSVRAGDDYLNINPTLDANQEESLRVTSGVDTASFRVSGLEDAQGLISSHKFRTVADVKTSDQPSATATNGKKTRVATCDQPRASELATRIKRDSSTSYRSSNPPDQNMPSRNRSDSCRGRASLRGARGRGRSSFSSSAHSDVPSSFRGQNNSHGRWNMEQENTPPSRTQGQRSTSWRGGPASSQRSSDRRVFSESENFGRRDTMYQQYRPGNFMSPTSMYSPTMNGQRPLFTSMLPTYGSQTPGIPPDGHPAYPYTAAIYKVAMMGLPSHTSQDTVKAMISALIPPETRESYWGADIRSTVTYLLFTAPFAPIHLTNMRTCRMDNGSTVSFQVPRAGNAFDHVSPGFHPANYALQTSHSNNPDNMDFRRPTNPFPEDEPHAEKELAIRNGAGQPLAQTRLAGDARLVDATYPDPKLPRSMPPSGPHSEAATSDTVRSTSKNFEPRKQKKKSAKKNRTPNSRIDSRYATSSRAVSGPYGDLQKLAQLDDVKNEGFMLKNSINHPTFPALRENDEQVPDRSQEFCGLGMQDQMEDLATSPVLRPASSLAISKRAPPRLSPIAPTRPASQPSFKTHDRGPQNLTGTEEASIPSGPEGIRAASDTIITGEISQIADMTAAGQELQEQTLTRSTTPSTSKPSAKPLRTRQSHRQITPWRSITEQSSAHTPGTEDIEDSFQTAVESPDSVRQEQKAPSVSQTKEVTTRGSLPAAGDVDRTIAKSPAPDLVTSRDTPEPTGEATSPLKDISNEAIVKQATRGGKVKAQLLETEVREPGLPSLAAEQPVTSNAVVASKTRDALRPSGPKQTESLSPFARQAQLKKKEKKAKQKALQKVKKEKGSKPGTSSAPACASTGQRSGQEKVKAESTVDQIGTNGEPFQAASPSDGETKMPLSPTKTVLKGIKEGVSRPFKYLAGTARPLHKDIEDHSAEGAAPPLSTASAAVPEAKGSGSTHSGGANEPQGEWKLTDEPSSPSTLSADSITSLDRRNEEFSFRASTDGRSTSFACFDGANSDQAQSDATSDGTRSLAEMATGKGEVIASSDALVIVTRASHPTRTSIPTPDSSRPSTPIQLQRKIKTEKPHLVQPRKNTLSARKKRKAKRAPMGRAVISSDDKSKADDKVSETSSICFTEVEQPDGSRSWVALSQPKKRKYKPKTATERENQRKDRLRYPIKKLEHEERMLQYERENDHEALEQEEQAWARYERRRNGEDEPWFQMLLDRFQGRQLLIQS
ncbi:Eukaryotic translation initiation factor 4 gamma [Sphaceloma murrayae]|uniref:Eukaryotic translation initiation factor 4 gamma n=1 Tax=Sphaceloma murrayae TaxID=2082308 RepID=A0A2K1QFY5_9PEZI|nr:Eukaryotic translation initiation factor 4 gamma [Sphaceloma murrayae]